MMAAPAHKTWCAIRTPHRYCNCFLDQRRREYERPPLAEIEADRANEPDDREQQERERYEAL